MRRRVVVTGVGLVSPLGIGTSVTWRALLEGKSGVGPITLFDASALPARIAGEVPSFDPSLYLDHKDIKKTDRFVQLALAATQHAMEASGLVVDETNAERVGVVIGSGIGGLSSIEQTAYTVKDRGPGRISPFFIPSLIVNMAAGQVSIRYGARGPNMATCTACTTGAHAVGEAFRLIRDGYADAVISGGAEAVVTMLGVGGFCAMRALSTRNDAPEAASRPWDRDRDGFVVGEGAGILVLEELEGAKARGAEILAEVIGYGMSGDAYHMSAPHPEGLGAIQAMKSALADAAVAPESVGYINAHATSTQLGDVAELAAVKAVFGDHARQLAVSSTKSATGHLLGAAGGLEAAILALSLHEQVLPPTINLEHPDEGCDLDLVPNTARETKLEVALSNSFGFGGTNAALVMRRL
jgi:3-oxoacyl-[acyl-carrier-protein] synthase II